MHSGWQTHDTCRSRGPHGHAHLADLLELLGVPRQCVGTLRCGLAQLQQCEVLRVLQLGAALAHHGLVAHRPHALLAGGDLLHIGVVDLREVSCLSGELCYVLWGLII